MYEEYKWKKQRRFETYMAECGEKLQRDQVVGGVAFSFGYRAVVIFDQL
jgi:hypothetical protein